MSPEPGVGVQLFGGGLHQGPLPGKRIDQSDFLNFSLEKKLA